MRRDFLRQISRKAGSFLPVLSALLLGSVALAWVGWQWVQTEFPPVEVLGSQYPVVHFRGPGNPPTVELISSRPLSWVRISSVSSHAVGAILVSEDWAFYSHPGYDLDQMREAMQHDLKKGRFARGASTITQQVVRNVFLTREKTLWRKIRELVLAARLDRELSKSRILEIYLNIAEWGPGIFGIGKASQFYFNKAPSELTAREGAFLALLLPSPIRYGQSFRQKKLTPYARKTLSEILSKMVRAQRITEEQRSNALAERMAFEAPVEVSKADGEPKDEPEDESQEE